MLKMFFDHMKLITLFGIMAFALSATIYWIDVYFERRINTYEIVIYPTEEEVIFGDDEWLEAVRRATVIEHFKKNKI